MDFYWFKFLRLLLLLLCREYGIINLLLFFLLLLLPGFFLGNLGYKLLLFLVVFPVILRVIIARIELSHLDIGVVIHILFIAFVFRLVSITRVIIGIIEIAILFFHLYGRLVF